MGVGRLGAAVSDSGTLTPLTKRFAGAGLLQRQRSERDDAMSTVAHTGRQAVARWAEAIPLCILQLSGCDLPAIESLDARAAGLARPTGCPNGDRACTNPHPKIKETHVSRKVLYRAQANLDRGREGTSRSSDGILDVKLTTPGSWAAMACPVPTPNSCSPRATAPVPRCLVRRRQAKVALPADTTITGDVGIGPLPTGFGIEVTLTVAIPGVDRAVAQDLVDRRTSCARTRTRRAATST